MVVSHHRVARLALLVMLVLGVADGSAAASPRTAPFFANASSPLLASGISTVSGGTITAAVLPQLGKLGDSGQMLIVASAPIDSSGYYELHADPSGGAIGIAIAQAASNGGWLNLDLTAIGANGKMVVTSVPRQFVHGRWIGSDGTAGVSGKSALIRHASPGWTSAGTNSCGEIVTLYSEGTTDATVGELHTGDDQTGTFTYGVTADTDAEVGLRIAGQSDWSVSGTAHVGNTLNSAAQWVKGAQFGYKLRTSHDFKEYYHARAGGICGGSYYETRDDHWTASPDATALGENVHSLDNSCGTSSYQSRFTSGSTWTRNANNFTWFSGAFSAFGFSARTQSGSSTHVTSHWKFGTAYPTYWLCGSDATITSSHRIYAGY